MAHVFETIYACLLNVLVTYGCSPPRSNPNPSPNRNSGGGYGHPNLPPPNWIVLFLLVLLTYFPPEKLWECLNAIRQMLN